MRDKARKYALFNIRTGLYSSNFGLCWEHFKKYQYETPALELSLIQTGWEYPQCSLCLGPPQSLPESNPDLVEMARAFFRSLGSEQPELPPPPEELSKQNQEAKRSWRDQKWAK